MNLKEEIKETIQGWYGDPDSINSEVDDILKLIERYIDEYIENYVNNDNGRHLSDKTYSSIALIDLKEKIKDG